MTEIKTKRCAACEETLPLQRFYKMAASKDGHQYRCIDCARLAHKHYSRETRAVAREEKQRSVTASQAALTCGVDGHEDDCLCDVVITQPVEIMPELNHLWMLKETAEYFDYSVPWTDEKMLDLFERLVELHDKWVHGGYADAVNKNGSIEGRLNQETHFAYWKRIKEAVVDHYHSTNGTLADTIKSLGLTLETYNKAVSYNRGKRAYSWEDVDAIVTDVQSGMSLYGLCKKWDLSDRGAGKWYHQNFKVRVQS